MSTVKEIIDEFCDRILQPREATLFGSSKPAARQFLSLFRFIGNELLSNQNGWDCLRRLYLFTTQTGVSNYQLPGDYERMLTGTQFGVTNQIPLTGPISNAQLAFQTYGTIAATPFATYQVNGAEGYIFNTSPYTQRSSGYFQVSPPGQNNTDQNVIAYVSNNWLWPRNWTTATAYVIGDIRSGINSIFYATTNGNSGPTRPDLAAVNSSGTVSDGTVTWKAYNEPFPISNDADFCLFDSELMIEGLRWAWYRAKKQDYAQERKDWESSVRSKLGAANGAVQVNAGYNLNLNPDWPNVPVGSWNI